MLRTHPVRILAPVCLIALALSGSFAARVATAAQTGAEDLQAPIDLRLLTSSTEGAQTQIEWSWRDKNRNEDGFLVEAKHNDGEWLLIPNEFPPADDPTLIRFLLTTGDTYYFHVRAFRGSGDARQYSNYSDTLTVIAGTTEPDDPNGRPDLIVSSASITVTPSGKGDNQVENVKVTFTVTNRGTQEAPPSHLYAKITVPVPHKKPKKVTAKIPIPSLTTSGDGSSFSQEYSLQLTPKQYQLIRGKSIKLIADGGKDIKESDEKNNTLQQVIP